MDEVIEWIGKLDAPISVGVCVAFGWQIVKYLQAEIERLRVSNATLVGKLEGMTDARMTDKDTAAEKFHTTVVRIEQDMQRASDSREAQAGTLSRIATKLGAA